MCVGGTARHLPRHINRLYRSHGRVFFWSEKRSPFSGINQSIVFWFSFCQFFVQICLCECEWLHWPHDLVGCR